MRSQIGGGGSTGSTIRCSSPSRRSQTRTMPRKCGSIVQQRVGARALLGIERAEHVFGRERVGVVVVHDVRHCSISNRLRRSEALSRLAGMSSLTASCSRLKAP